MLVKLGKGHLRLSIVRLDIKHAVLNVLCSSWLVASYLLGWASVDLNAHWVRCVHTFFSFSSQQFLLWSLGQVSILSSSVIILHSLRNWCTRLQLFTWLTALVKDKLEFLSALLFGGGWIISMSYIELRALSVRFYCVVPQMTHCRCTHCMLSHSCLWYITLRIGFYCQIFTWVEKRVVLLTGRGVKVAILNLNIAMESRTRSTRSKDVIDTRTAIRSVRNSGVIFQHSLGRWINTAKGAEVCCVVVYWSILWWFRRPFATNIVEGQRFLNF